ncbi:MAG: hypothetical protein P4L40_24605, partial [Terracidiphilus sp.]|nr:hypothetical protein [Terracidiphilus sp.]
MTNNVVIRFMSSRPSPSEMNRAILSAPSPPALLAEWEDLMPRRAFDIVNLTTAFLQLGRLTKSAPRSAAALSRDTYRIYNAVTAALRSCRFERVNIRDISDMVMGYRDARHRHKGLEAELFALIKDL